MLCQAGGPGCPFSRGSLSLRQGVVDTWNQGPRKDVCSRNWNRTPPNTPGNRLERLPRAGPLALPGSLRAGVGGGSTSGTASLPEGVLRACSRNWPEGGEELSFQSS